MDPELDFGWPSPPGSALSHFSANDASQRRERHVVRQSERDTPTSLAVEIAQKPLNSRIRFSPIHSASRCHPSHLDSQDEPGFHPSEGPTGAAIQAPRTGTLTVVVPACTTTDCSCRSLIATPDRAPRLIGFAAESGSVGRPSPATVHSTSHRHPLLTQFRLRARPTSF